MTYETQRQFARDLFGDGPFSGHGVRVNVPGPFDVRVLSQGNVEERARMGKAEFEWDRECSEAIGDDRVPALHLHTGTEVFAGAFGSPVHRPLDTMPFALPAVYTDEEADALEEPGLDELTLAEIWALGDRLVKLCGPGHDVRISDIQSPFDIAALIWEKEAFFRALVETPEAAHRLLAKVTDTLRRFARAFLRRYEGAFLVHYPELWMPPEFGICLSEDDCGSVSVRHFERFALSYLRKLALEFGGISLHCCADGQHQWDSFLKLPNLHYVNLFHPPTSLAQAMAKFSGRAVLVPSFVIEDPPARRASHGQLPFASPLDFVRQCLDLARPDTRYYFIVGAASIPEARELAREVKALCGRS